MAKKHLPDIGILRQLLRYDSETGKLYWRKRNEDLFIYSKYAEPCQLADLWNSKWAGKEAGTLGDGGYVNINLKIKKLSITARPKAHRIIWKMHYCEEPPKEIDHINGDRSDNRIENLRSVTRSQNNCNSKIRKTSLSGIKGVNFCKRRNVWRARIAINKKQINLGEFKHIEEAISARKAAEVKYHGEYARNSQ